MKLTSPITSHTQANYDHHTKRNPSPHGHTPTTVTSSQEYEPLHGIGGLASSRQYEPHQQRNVNKQLWYHGNLPRQKAEALLKCDGDFLVRDSSSQVGGFVLTCQWKKTALHFMINRQTTVDPHTSGRLRTQFQFETRLCDSVAELISVHVHEGVLISKASGAIISNAVPRRLSADSSLPTAQHSHPAPTAIDPRRLTKAKRADSQPLLDDFTDYSASAGPSSADPHSPLRGTVTSHHSRSGSQPVERDFSAGKSHHSRSGSEPVEQDFSAVTSHHSGAVRLKRSAYSSSHSQLSTVSKNTTSIHQQSGDGKASSSDAPPPKPSRIPTIKLAANETRPRVAIRNKALYEDDGKDYSDIEQVTSQPSGGAGGERRVEPPPALLRASSTSTDSGYDAGHTHATSFYDTVAGPSTPRPVVIKQPDMNPPSKYDVSDYVSQILTPHNKPLESSALSMVKALLLDTQPALLAKHLTLIDLDLFQVFGVADLGAGVCSGLELITLPQGAQARSDALERCVMTSSVTAKLAVICSNRLHLLYARI